MERPPYLLDIPADEYHAATKRNEFTTSHRLNLFRKCPALYKKTIDGEIIEGETEAFMLGRATHKLVLECVESDEKFASEFLVSDGPVNPKTDKPYGKATKAYQEWAAEQAKPVISMEDYALMVKMREAVHAHPVAKDLLASGIPEGAIRTTWDGEPVQARLDWFDPERGILIDFKTTADIDRFGFDIRDFGYVWQMAFYKEVLRRVGCDMPVKTYLVAVEKKEPYRVSVCELTPITLLDANDSAPGAKYGPGNGQMIAELQRCRKTGVWPTRYEDVILL